MNLILIKPNERSTSTTNTTARGVNDGANSSSSSSSVITVDLSPNDERTKHLLHHLHKQDGDSVSVGFIDGDEIAHFDDAALDALQFIARIGKQQQQKEIGH